ncbi:RHS repeat-associated core domain-containing protein, partial [Streptomyces sp. NPDC033538]|uniref:RHS repeat-associated core domain-containing protein n=1 Tax=Streptomyces sp. NPDC033538 TaxID=3155367 RepID=UPI0033EAE534
TTLAVTRRRQLPFGQLRSEHSEAMPGTRGFVSGTEDPTGLTHLGAREYDPALGSFISVDPLLDIDDPLQMNAYAYANSRPVTASDPDGKMIYDDFTGLGYGNTTAMKHAYQKWGYRDSKGHTTKKYRSKLAALNKSYNTYYKSSYYKKLMRESAQANARAAARAKAQADARAKAQAEARRKAAEAERRKKDSIWGKISSGLGKVKNNVTSVDWWKHKGIDMAVGFTATAGTAACIASVVCGGGLFIVGASALFVTGVGAHMAVATPEERGRGGAQYLKRTAITEGRGMLFGATFGRGAFGAFRHGAKQGIAGPGLSSRAGSDPLFAGIAARDWGAMRTRLFDHLRSFR